jgi:hypothetical protein
MDLFVYAGWRQIQSGKTGKYEAPSIQVGTRMFILAPMANGLFSVQILKENQMYTRWK